MAGTFDSTNPPKQPGLYINFVQAAKLNIIGGERGIVAIPLKETDATNGTAVRKSVYEVYNELEAEKLFGAANIQSIKFALGAGAKKVVVYLLPVIDGTTVTEASAYADARKALDGREFNVFTFDGEISATEKSNALTWVQTNRSEGKHFFVIIGGDDVTDLDPAKGDARTALYADDYVVNLTVGVVIAGVSFNSSEYSSYIAGLIANIALNRSLTYFVLPVDDVSVRLTKKQINDGLTAGSLLLIHDGEKVKIVQGLTSTVKKIRAIKTRQVVATDIAKTGEDTYIGKIHNTRDGQAALVSAIKAYLEQLEAANVLTDIEVAVDQSQDNSGDSVNLLVAYKDIDSVERIFTTIKI